MVFSAVVAKCGHLLIAAGAMMIDRFENEDWEVQRGESNNHDGPRLCAFRAQGPHDQAPIRPSRMPLESQAGQRGLCSLPYGTLGNSESADAVRSGWIKGASVVGSCCPTTSSWWKGSLDDP